LDINQSFKYLNFLEKEMSGKLTVQFIDGKEKSFEFDPQVQFGEGATTNSWR